MGGGAGRVEEESEGGGGGDHRLHRLGVRRRVEAAAPAARDGHVARVERVEGCREVVDVVRRHAHLQQVPDNLGDERQGAVPLDGAAVRADEELREGRVGRRGLVGVRGGAWIARAGQLGSAVGGGGRCGVESGQSSGEARGCAPHLDEIPLCVENRRGGRAGRGGRRGEQAATTLVNAWPSSGELPARCCEERRAGPAAAEPTDRPGVSGRLLEEGVHWRRVPPVYLHLVKEHHGRPAVLDEVADVADALCSAGKRVSML